MAIIDLSKFNLLDMLPLSFFDEEKKDEYIYRFSSSYADYITLQIGQRLKEEDEEMLQALMSDPLLEVDDIENFFRDKIKDFDSFLLGEALGFKKAFLLKVYKQMQEMTTEAKDPTAETWGRIVEEANADNWDAVYDLIRVIEERSLEEQMAQSNPTPQAQTMAV